MGEVTALNSSTRSTNASMSCHGSAVNSTVSTFSPIYSIGWIIIVNSSHDITSAGIIFSGSHSLILVPSGKCNSESVSKEYTDQSTCDVDCVCVTIQELITEGYLAGNKNEKKKYRSWPSKNLVYAYDTVYAFHI